MPVVSKLSESSTESSKLVYDNFYEWQLETEKELAAAGILEWVTDPPAFPATASLQLAWRKEQKETRKIIVSSLSMVIYEKYQELIKAGDMKVLWDAIQAAGTAHSSGAQHIANIKEELGKEVYNPSIESANDYVSRLRKYRLRLSGDTHPFTDADIKAKLIASLPRLGDWKIVRSALQNNPGDLEAVLHQLIEYQLQWKDELKVATTAEPTAMEANWVANRGRGRGRGHGGYRGSRARGRGGWRGGKATGDHRDASGRVEKTAKLDRNQCAKCRKFGHWKNECRTKETANVAADQSETFKPCFTDRTYLTEEVQQAYTSITAANQWKLDSGATKHFSGVYADFTSLKRWRDKQVKTANNQYSSAEGYGDVQINGMILHNVWYVPDFGSTRLLSIGALAEDGISTIFNNTGAKCYKDNNLVLSATKASGLYVLDSNTEANTVGTKPSEPLVPETHLMESSYDDQNQDTIPDLIHRRLGHINYQEMVKLEAASGYGIKLGKRMIHKGEKSCESCLAGRMKEHFTKKTDTRANTPLRRLHADISGIQCQSIRGYRYYLVVVDDATRVCWVRLLKDKTAAVIQPEIKLLKTQLELQKGQVVVYWRTDNGKGEFGNAFMRWLQELGIQSEPSPPYKQSLNGVSEHWIYQLSKIVRSMLYDAKQPDSLWCYAVEHAARLKNRRPTKALPYQGVQGLTPLEAWEGAPASLSHYRVFGARAWPLRPKATFPRKLEPRIQPGKYILVGMTSSHIYRLLNIKNQQELISADVKFNEYTTWLVTGKAETVARPPKVGRPANRAERPLVGRPDAETGSEGIGAETGPIRAPRERPDAEIGSAGRPLQGRPDAETGSVVRPLGRPDAEIGSVIRPLGERPDAETGSARRPLVERLARDVNAQRQRSSTTQSSDQRLANLSSKPTESRYGRQLKPRRVYGESITALGAKGATAPPIQDSVTLEQALQENKVEWMRAIKEEYSALRSTRTYEIRYGEPPIGKKLITSKLVLRNKLHSDGSLARRKARITARGFEQQHGSDYFDTYASVLRPTTLRVLLALAAHRDYEADHVDIDTAFLNPKLKEEIYMEIPQFFVDTIHPELKGRPDAYLRLLRSLYGLKQAPREWWLMVKEVIENTFGLT